MNILNGKKAVLMDYTGTMIRTGGPEAEEMIARIYKNSDFESPREAVRWWFGNLSAMEKKSFGTAFLTEDELCLSLLDLCEKEHGLRDDHEALHRLNQGLWRNGPVFDDVLPFFEKCRLPVFVLTNNAASYLEENLEKHGLHVAGIVSAEDVRAYKPHREIFEKALLTAGVDASEALHIGDSYESDALGAKAAGIDAVLVDRSGKETREGCVTVRSLAELLP